MRALQEKRPVYLDASDTFMKRFKNYMSIVFGQTLMDIQASASNSSLKATDTIISVDDLNAGRASLWKYSPLILYAKSLDRGIWRDIIKTYQSQMQTMYTSGIASTLQASQKLARGTPGDEQDLLFTGEAQVDALGLAGRKLTVKRSQTLARSLRASSGEKALRQGVTRTPSQSGTFLPYEAIEQALNEITPLLLSEQAFIVDFFHANTTETVDFAERVQAMLPENRRGPLNLNRKVYEPDQQMTTFVTEVMANIFHFLPTEIQNSISWAVSVGPLQGIGILHALYVKMGCIEDGFYFRTLHTLSTRLSNEWSRFLTTQVRAIEETQVKINKRKGILYFMRVFPLFAAYVENMLPPASTDQGEVRVMVDQGYAQINKAMFNSLRAIAKESPASHAPSNDPEDKESLNYHILLIENMNHYVENVEVRTDPVLEEWQRKATEEYDEHLSLYVDSVIRRPLGKIMVGFSCYPSAHLLTYRRTLQNLFPQLQILLVLLWLIRL
jgi:hypothetical protein